MFNPLELTIVPVPQHQDATERCLFCGEKDGRTKAGAIYCHDCMDAGVQGSIRLPIQINLPHS